jgi:hypothetical protein
MFRPTPSPGLPRRHHDTGGFVLLITVVLVAFLVLIVISLATLSRVETSITANSQQVAQARQNALLALNLAIGQLQKHAGPDQRVSARADLQGGETVANARWTGIYGRTTSAGYTQAPSALAAELVDPTVVDSDTGSSARLLSWLVSGNENDAFAPASAVGADGRITATAANLAAGLSYSPASPVAGLDAAATIATPLSIQDRNGTTSPAALLVGPGTVDTAVSSGHALDYVAAPLVDIKVSADQIPGLAGTSSVAVGRYAWWVGDEGVKARANLPLVTDEADMPVAFANATRDAVELMDRTNPAYPAPALADATIGTDYDPAVNVARMLDLAQFPLAGTPPLRDALRRRYHDMGTHSAGVLSDTLAGGLRRDLTALLDTAYTPGSGDPEADSTRLYVADAGTGAFPEETPGFGIPTWAHLRSYYRNITPASGVLTPRLPVFEQPGQTDDTGLSPVLSYVALGFGFAANGTGIEFNVYPLVVLWNPYSRPIEAHTYEVGLRIPPPGTNLQLQVRDPSLPTNPWVSRETRDVGHEGLLIGSGADPSQTDDVGRYFRFPVECPRIAAGESIVFTLPASATYNRLATTPCSRALKPGLEPNTYASLGGGSVEAAELDWDYRVVAAPHYFKAVPGRNEWSGARFSNAADNSGTILDENGAAITSKPQAQFRGALDAYLGEPRKSPVTTVAQADIWDPRLNTWYQLASGVQFGAPNVLALHVMQGGVGVPLSSAVPGDDPGVILLLSALFARGGTDDTIQISTSNKYSWLLHGNPRAPMHFKTRRDDTATSNYAARVDTNGWPTWFVTSAPGDRASAGFGHDWQKGAPVDAVVFESRPAADSTLGLGRLQQANLSLNGTQPAYPFGNSYADPRLFELSRLSDSTLVRGSGRPELARAEPVYYDNSYLLNRALWDRYFLSSLPRSGSTEPVNPRLKLRSGSPYNALLPESAAASLLVDGAFNINSTSEQAWRAVLGGVNRLSYNPETRATGSARQSALPRFEQPVGDATVPLSAGDPGELWDGYRELTDAEIAQLARNLVAEVRARGPFVSLADFINRRLVDNPATAEDERVKGALQAAIDATQQTLADAHAPNNTNGTLWQNPALRLFATTGNNKNFHSLDAALGSSLGISDNSTGQRVFTDSAKTQNAAFRRLAAGAPKFLTQGDVLATIGGGLSARSDTFVIRTYGEVLNPLDNGTVRARAWCEAVVQRVPEYHAGSVAPWETPVAGSPDRDFGRRFKIVSFRWLPADQI